jgi:hypothetical protein
LQDKYNVVPDKDPQSLEEAKAVLDQVRKRKRLGTKPFDSLRLDWLQACATYWTAKEGLKQDAKTKADVEFCLANQLLELEEVRNKYVAEELKAKKVPDLRKMCADEIMLGSLECVKEPWLFGKKAYLIGLLSAIQTQPGGMRAFVTKKLNKIQAVQEKMVYQETRIKFFKDALENEKIKAAEEMLKDDMRELEAKIKKEEFDKLQGEKKKAQDRRREENEKIRAKQKQDKLDEQIKKIKEDRVRELAEAKDKAAALAKEKEEAAQKRAAVDEARSRKEHADLVKAQERARVLEAKQNALNEKNGSLKLHVSLAGSWRVKRQGHVRVREIPDDAGKPTMYKYFRDNVEGEGGVLDKDEKRMWLKLKTPDTGFILIDERPLVPPKQISGSVTVPPTRISAIGSNKSHVGLETKSGAGSQEAEEAPLIEKIRYEVGVNEYDEDMWKVHFSDLQAFKVALHKRPLQSGCSKCSRALTFQNLVSRTFAATLKFLPTPGGSCRRLANKTLPTNLTLRALRPQCGPQCPRPNRPRQCCCAPPMAFLQTGSAPR